MKPPNTRSTRSFLLAIVVLLFLIINITTTTTTTNTTTTTVIQSKDFTSNNDVKTSEKVSPSLTGYHTNLDKNLDNNQILYVLSDSLEVDPDNNCTSIQNPCNSLRAAVSKSKANDVIKLMPGIYQNYTKYCGLNISHSLTISGMNDVKVDATDAGEVIIQCGINIDALSKSLAEEVHIFVKVQEDSENPTDDVVIFYLENIHFRYTDVVIKLDYSSSHTFENITGKEEQIYKGNNTTTFHVYAKNLKISKSGTGIVVTATSRILEDNDTSGILHMLSHHLVRLFIQNCSFYRNINRGIFIAGSGINGIINPSLSTYGLDNIQVNIYNSTFIKNSVQLFKTSDSSSNGAAIKVLSLLNKNVTVKIEGSVFQDNGLPSHIILINATSPDGKRRFDVYDIVEYDIPEFDIPLLEFAYRGGAISAEATQSNLMIKRCTFSGNRARNFGGAIFASISNNANIKPLLNIDQSTFLDNLSRIRGGAVGIFSYDCVISKSIFKNNYARRDGGAIYGTFMNSMVIVGSKFIENEAEEKGNIFILSTSSMIFNQSICYKNTVFASGGCIFTNRVEQLNIYESIFTENTALISGGAIHHDSNVPEQTFITTPYMTEIHNSHFLSNKIGVHRSIEKNDGSAVYIREVTISFKKCKFEKNYGGASLFFSAGEGPRNNRFDISIDQSIFESNTALVTGGGLCVLNCRLNISNSEFIGNIASAGGALTLLGEERKHTAIFRNVTFLSNQATDKKNARGGAIIFESSFAELYDSHFISNQGSHGGALFGNNVGIKLINVSCKQNHASFHGGALFIEHMFEMKLILSEFLSNAAVQIGGAILLEGTQISQSVPSSIDKSIFKDNHANEAGALAFFDRITYSRRASLLIRNSKFTGNGARDKGGSMMVTSQIISLNDCEISSSVATNGGGVYAGSNAELSFTNMIFHNNSAINPTTSTSSLSSGGAIFATTSKISIADGVFSNNSALDGKGGAINCDVDSYVDLRNISFLRNQAAEGGGIDIFHAKCSLQQSEFANNLAHFGGAIKLKVRETSDLSAFEIKFRNNIATVAGGGVFFDHYTSMPTKEELDILFQTLDMCCSFVRNIAFGYGDNFASKPAQINLQLVKLYNRIPSILFNETGPVLVPVSYNSTMVMSSNFAVHPSQLFEIHLEIVDAFKQKTINFPQLQVRVNTLGENTILTGEDFEELVVGGNAVFRGLQLVGVVGSSVILKIEAVSGVPHEKLSIRLRIDECDIGYRLQDVPGHLEFTRCEWCAMGSYSLKEGARTCRQCENAECEGYSVRSKKNYWTYTDRDAGRVETYFCSNSHCIGNNECSGSRDPTHPLCGTCLPSHSKWNGSCLICEGGVNWIFIILFAFYGFGLFGFYHVSAQSRKSGATKILTFYVQTLGLLVGGYSQLLNIIPSVFNFQFISSSGGGSFFRCPFQVSSMGSLIIDFSRPVSFFIVLFIMFIFIRIMKKCLQFTRKRIEKLRRKKKIGDNIEEDGIDHNDANFEGNDENNFLSKQNDSTSNQEQSEIEHPSERRKNTLAPRKGVRFTPAAFEKIDGGYFDLPENIAQIENENEYDQEGEFKEILRQQKKQIYLSYNNQDEDDVLKVYHKAFQRTKETNSNLLIYGEKLASLIFNMFWYPSAYIVSFSNLLIVTFQSLVVTTFGFFQCKAIGIGDEFHKFVMIDGTDIECFKGEWMSFLPLFIIVTLYCIFFPMCLLIFLLFARKKNWLYRKKFARYFGLFYLNYRPSMFWYEPYALFRRLILVCGLVFFNTRIPPNIIIGILLCVMLLIQILLKPFVLEEANIVEAVSYISLIIMSFLHYIGTSSSNFEIQLYSLLFIVLPTFILLFIFVFRHTVMRKIAIWSLGKIKYVFCIKQEEKDRLKKEMERRQRHLMKKRKYAMKELGTLKLQSFESKTVDTDATHSGNPDGLFPPNPTLHRHSTENIQQSDNIPTEEEEEEEFLNDSSEEQES